MPNVSSAVLQFPIQAAYTRNQNVSCTSGWNSEIGPGILSIQRRVLQLKMQSELGGNCAEKITHPNVFSYTLDPISQLIDTAIPLSQSYPHSINLPGIQHLWLHPIYSCNLCNLIDAAPQKTQTQSLHDQYLNLRRRHVRLFRDCMECHCSSVWRAAKNSFRKCGQRDFLV